MIFEFPLSVSDNGPRTGPCAPSAVFATHMVLPAPSAALLVILHRRSWRRTQIISWFSAGQGPANEFVQPPRAVLCCLCCPRRFDGWRRPVQDKIILITRRLIPLTARCGASVQGLGVSANWVRIFGGARIAYGLVTHPLRDTIWRTAFLAEFWFQICIQTQSNIKEFKRVNYVIYI